MHAFLLICLLALPSPNPGYRVLDQANILSDGTRSRLETLSREVDRATTAEIAVVTVSSLDGASIEQYANQLFNEWGIGKRGVNNGVLILVAPNERRIRIEVGYGIEPLLSDGLCGDIIADYAVPAFKEGDFENGIVTSAEEIARVIRAHPDAARGVAGSAPSFVVTQMALSTYSLYGASLFGIMCLGITMIVSHRRYFPAWLYLVMAVSIVMIPGAILWSAWNNATGLLLGLNSFLPLCALGFATRRFLRYGFHLCPKCKSTMSLLDEIKDDDHLEAVQKMEEKFGSVDYDVWVCQVCLAKDTEGYIEWFSEFEACPKCDQRTFREVSTTIRPATTISTGLEKIRGECKSCQHTTSRNETLSRISGSSSGSGGGSSGGGSFGGGRSGGGGASGSW